MLQQLIIGCGYLGRRLCARLLEAGLSTTLTTRHATGIEALESAGARHIQFDLNDSASWSQVDKLFEDELDIFFLLPPSQVDLLQLQKFLEHIPDGCVGRIVVSSSTVVYGSNGELVDASSPVSIEGPRATKQWQIEELFRSSGFDTRIARLAGLYGPDRIIGKKGLIKGELIPGSADAWLNLLHVEDAAGLIFAIMQSDSAAEVELGCDGNPVKRQVYYQDLARYLQCVEPVFEQLTNETAMGRRCDNSPTCRRTGWQPLYPDYTQAWAAS